MSKTINQRFNDFNNKLKISPTESKALRDHRQSIYNCLNNYFSLDSFFKTGSIGQGTNVSGFSDTDYFAGIPSSKLKKVSTNSLLEIKNVLEKRFPLTDITIRQPSVVVNFGKSITEKTEITPACFISNDLGFNVYGIPDTNGGRQKASPKNSNNYVRKIDLKHNNKVKPLIRFIKAIKYYNNIPVSSYYLEMFVSKYADNENYIDYIVDIKIILKKIISSNLSNMYDPSGFGGLIIPCSTDKKKEDSLSRLKTALSRIENANSSLEEGNMSDTLFRINLAYNYKFPNN